jgi:hypothetical protein
MFGHCSRRDVSGSLPLLTLAACHPPNGSAPDQDTIARRTLGTTGVEVSTSGVGGYRLGTPKHPAVAMRAVRHALDGGVAFLRQLLRLPRHRGRVPPRQCGLGRAAKRW